MGENGAVTLSRRAVLPLLPGLGAAALTGCSDSDRPSSTGSAGLSTSPSVRVSRPTATPTPTPTPTRTVPGGQAALGNGYRLVGWCGHPGAPGQGRLGVGDDLDKRAGEMLKVVASYQGDKPLVPIMELIVTTVHGAPGRDGMYRTRIDDAHIQTWLATARKHRALMLLNIQPGRARFVDEVKAYRQWLLEPDVGLALDPEWAVTAGQVPGRVFGHTTGAELNAVGAYLQDLVAEHALPEKVCVYHQLNPGVVRQENTLKRYEGVAWVKSVDGIGSPGAKVATWNRVIKNTPKFVHLGFKLFYEEDVETGGRLMTPQEVLALKPAYVMYE